MKNKIFLVDITQNLLQNGQCLITKTKKVFIVIYFAEYTEIMCK